MKRGERKKDGGGGGATRYDGNLQRFSSGGVSGTKAREKTRRNKRESRTRLNTNIAPNATSVN